MTHYKKCLECGNNIKDYNKVDDVHCDIHDYCFEKRAKYYEFLWQKELKAMGKNDRNRKNN